MNIFETSVQAIRSVVYVFTLQYNEHVLQSNAGTKVAINTVTVHSHGYPYVMESDQWYLYPYWSLSVHDT